MTDNQTKASGPVAIIGASGFIGGRVVEMFTLNQFAEVRPIVRSNMALTRISRFDLDIRLADATNVQDLTAALAGCDTLVNCVLGNERTIADSVKPIYRAAQAASVKRIVYLSSASVYGQCPEAGVTEETPLSDKHLLAYNNAKVHAEQEFLKLRNTADVELVMLRPGLVWGPRSQQWTAGIADLLLSGQFCFVGDGSGICNCIYVDNVVQAIQLALQTEGKAVDKQAFFIADKELITWRQFIEPLANVLSVDIDGLAQRECPKFERGLKDTLDEIRSSPYVQAVLPYVPARIKEVTKAALTASMTLPAVSSAWELPLVREPSLTMEMALLQSCQYKLPTAKSESLLGFQPAVSFAEGARRSQDWLSFIGYPTNAKVQ